MGNKLDHPRTDHGFRAVGDRYWHKSDESMLRGSGGLCLSAAVLRKCRLEPLDRRAPLGRSGLAKGVLVAEEADFVDGLIEWDGL